MSHFDASKPWDSNGMQPSGVPRRSLVSSDDEMDITPMIDITFLLLIFFIVASRIDAGSEYDLPIAQNGTAVTVKNSCVLTMYGGRPDFTDVYVGDGKNQEKVNALDPIVQEELLVAWVENQFRENPSRQQVIVRADKATKHREVARVLRALGQVNNVSVYVAVLE